MAAITEKGSPEKASKKKIKSGLRWLTWSAVLAVASAGGWFAYSLTLKNSTDAVEVRAIEVKKDTLESRLTESGTVELGGQQTLKSPADGGIVTEVLVEVGDRVSAGEPVVILRDPERDTILRNHQLDMQEKELSLAAKRQKVAEASTNVAVAQEKLQAIANRYRADAAAKLRDRELQIQQKELDLAEKRQQALEAEAALASAERKLQNRIDRQGAEYQPRLRQQQLAIEQQELQLANLRLKVVEAEEDLASVRLELQEDEELFKRGFIPENDVQRRQKEVRSEEASLRDARLAVRDASINLEKSRLDLQTIKEEIEDAIVEAANEAAAAALDLRGAQLAVKTANIELDSLRLGTPGIEEEIQNSAFQAENERRQASAELRQAVSALQAARDEARSAFIDIEKHQLARQEIEQKIQESIVTAPSEGVILDIKAKKGEVVRLSDALLTQGNAAVELVRLQISTLNAAKVRRGQLARVILIGSDEQSFTGQVEELSLLASSGESSSGGQSGEATVAATVRLDAPTGVLIPGIQVSVDIILEQRQDVVAVNTEAIARSGSETFVWVRDEAGTAQKRPVTLGLEDFTTATVEISSGLEPGDEVLLPPIDEPLEEGMPVSITQGGSVKTE